MSDEQHEILAGLQTTLIGKPQLPTMVVILLHGFGMQAADLTPFAHSLGGHQLYVLPQAPFVTSMGGYGWWDIDLVARAQALQRGPRDLVNEYPAGLPRARAQLGKLIAAINQRFAPNKIVLGGFSQGGMLACDYFFHEHVPELAGLFLFSSSRINFDAWSARRRRLAGLPVLITHGRADTDLSFAAGQALRDFVQAGGAQAHWVEFEQGHQIPLVVWRELRRFIRNIASHN